MYKVYQNGKIKQMDKIDELLTRGVEKIYPTPEDLEKVLRSGKKLKLYQGFDPTSSQLHIGHLVGLRKMRHFQDLGHEVIFLIGDFTGMIGDPTGKFSERKQLTREQVLENSKTYKQQVSKILNFEGDNPVKIKYNSEWLGKMSAIEFFELSHLLSYQQVVERDMFQERKKKGQDVFMNEFLYPVLQAYDSVAMDVDLELGGSDQMFNMMMGRHLMHKMKSKEKFVMTTPLLVDSTGKKIGKTEGNVIALTANPNDFYGMVLSLGDDVIVKAFEYLTDLPMEEVKKIEEGMKNGENPMIYKKQLAHTLTTILNNNEEADRAQEEFEQVHQKNNFPEEVEPSAPANSLKEFLVAKGYSSSVAKNLIDQGSVDINGTTIKDKYIEVNVGDKIKIGKKKFYKVVDSQ